MLSEGDARGVVDTDMDEFPTGADAAAAGAVFGDAMARFVEAIELLDVEVDHLAGAAGSRCSSAATVRLV